MELELKHLAPYLPYKLKCKDWSKKIIGYLTSIDTNSNQFTFTYYKESDLHWEDNYTRGLYPILRPLSDLTKEINNGVGLFYPYKELNLCYSDVVDFLNKDLWIGQWFDYEQISKLLEWHFDVFGLIEQGLAVDINDLPN